MRRRHVVNRFRAALGALCLSLGTVAFAQDPEVPPLLPEPPPIEAPAEVPPVALEEAAAKTVLFPDDDVFPVYVADPQRPGNAAMAHFYTKTHIAESSSERTGLKAGGHFGVVRFDRPARSWQISIDAGMDAMFDAQEKLDVIGWDGNYGFTCTTAGRGPFSFRFGILHLSAHVGDEYMERTGRERIDYTREEVVLGTRYRLAPRVSAYFEAGVAYKELTEEQKPWRLQGGLEWEGTPHLLGGHFAWYGALDLQAFEERDWRVDFAVQGGVASRGHGRVWRFGVEYYNGRAPLGEFFQDTEARVTVGMWLDL